MGESVNEIGDENSKEGGDIFHEWKKKNRNRLKHFRPIPQANNHQMRCRTTAAVGTCPLGENGWTPSLLSLEGVYDRGLEPGRLGDCPIGGGRSGCQSGAPPL